MARVLSFAKYQVSSMSIVIGSFYLGVLTFALITALFGWTGEMNSGMVIVAFVVGLNCFKTSFLFAQANNISRRSFYFANILALFALAIGTSCTELVATGLLQRMVSYRTAYFFDYYPMGLFSRLILTTALMMLLASLGWLINMIYYRSNAIMKVVVSLSPIGLVFVFNYFNDRTQGGLWNALIGFVQKALGFQTEVPNPYIAVLSFTIGSIAILLFNYLLMYRTPVKAR